MAVERRLLALERGKSKRPSLPLLPFSVKEMAPITTLSLSLSLSLWWGSHVRQHFQLLNYILKFPGTSDTYIACTRPDTVSRLVGACQVTPTFFFFFFFPTVENWSCWTLRYGEKTRHLRIRRERNRTVCYVPPNDHAVDAVVTSETS